MKVDLDMKTVLVLAVQHLRVALLLSRYSSSPATLGCCDKQVGMLRQTSWDVATSNVGMLRQASWDVATNKLGCCDEHVGMLLQTSWDVATSKLLCCHKQLVITHAWQPLHLSKVSCSRARSELLHKGMPPSLGGHDVQLGLYRDLYSTFWL